MTSELGSTTGTSLDARSSTIHSQVTCDDSGYHEFLKRIQQRFDKMVKTPDGKLRQLFTTNAENLFDAFLNGISPERRQHYLCRCCQNFVNHYCSLVAIDENGETTSVLREMHPGDIPAELQGAVKAVALQVQSAKVTGPFISSIRELGTHLTITTETSKNPRYQWRHMSVNLPQSMIHRGIVQTAGQEMAEKREDFRNVQVALTEFSPAHIDQAITLLQTDSLYRSEKCLGVAQWLKSLHEIRAVKNHRIQNNLMWVKIASAPAGFCHPRSSMIGSLLEDLASGMSFDAVSRRFASKMHPLQYQRPQVAPSVGNIAEAEKIISKLKAAGSLERRFARLEEIETIWKPQIIGSVRSGSSVFSHLVNKDEKTTSEISTNSISITWEKFRREVLPIAKQIEFSVPFRSMPYSALVTATNPEAPPIIQWDSEECRNPFSWYLYHNGSTARNWGLLDFGTVKVNAITFQPSMWYPKYDESGKALHSHQGEGVLFVLEGCRDVNDAQLCLFPEILKSEFHGIRSTIEAHCRTAKISERENATACGLMLQKNATKNGNGSWNATFKVKTASGVTMQYNLERWD